MNLPVKTIARLSKYRRLLQQYKELQEYYIFSHDLAGRLGINPVHVRRDLMLTGFSGNYRHGYHVPDLLRHINQFLPKPGERQAIIIGMGEEGRMMLIQIMADQNCPVSIPFTFDVEPAHTDKKYSGIPCYNLTKAPALIQNENIKIAILTSINFHLQEIVNSLVPLGIESIVNCTPEIIIVPKHISIIELDILNVLEEVSYSINSKDQK
jgi:NADH/NAD ratio-sensing transcriptional regulator Rex